MITDMENCAQGTLGMQLSLDETTYRTMFEALSDVAQARSGRLAELRDVIYGMEGV